MILLGIVAVLGFIIGGLGGILIGAKNSSKITAELVEIKTKLEGVHLNTEGVKDAVVKVAEDVKTGTDTVTSAAQTISDVASAVTTVTGSLQAASQAADDIKTVVDTPELKASVEKAVSDVKEVVTDQVAEAKAVEVKLVAAV